MKDVFSLGILRSLRNNFLLVLTICAVVTQVEGVTSKEHTGTVNLPVGSNLGGLQLWSSGSTWEGGAKPSAGADVVIPANSVVVLNQNIDVKSITVKGKLIVDISKNISIDAEYIMVMGAGGYFEWGTETELYNKEGVITLVGNDPTIKMPGTNVESKAIMVMNGATIELHGAAKTSWTTLAVNAAANQNKIQVTETTNNWKVGDEILIAPSRLNWNEGEKKSITAISNGQITLNSNLTYPHIGALKSYASPDGKSWEGDMRAEVGLLSKSIKIQGDASSVTNQYGGHIMMHVGGVAHVENIELYRMGQKAIMGRYPFHWHLIQEKGQGQYLKNSSIHSTYNRAITVHGTESTLVENNFCYDHIGHGIFLEDGSERFNVIRGNVVLLTKRPAAGEELTPSDNQFDVVQNRTPSSFWITNPNNIFENNIAAGTQGTGYWFAMPKKPMGPSAGLPRFANIVPYKEPLGKFEGNKAHSCRSGFDIFDQLTATHSIAKNAPWQRTDDRVMNKCTWYANELGVYGGIGGGRKYTEGVIFKDNVFIDNKVSIMHANYADHLNCVFVARSGENVFEGKRQLLKAYDGACSITNSHLIGWDQGGDDFVIVIGGGNKHPNYVMSGITKDHAGPPIFDLKNYNKIPKGPQTAQGLAHPRTWIFSAWDKDGSLTGQPDGGTVICNHSFLRDGTERPFHNSRRAYFTPYRYAYLVAPGIVNGPKITYTRRKPGTSLAGYYFINGVYGRNMSQLILSQGFEYTLQFETLPTNRVWPLSLEDAYVAGDHVLIKMKNMGRLNNIKADYRVSAGVRVDYPSVNSLADLNDATETTTYKSANDFYIMIFVNPRSTRGLELSWDATTINWPVLDTDGDGISDFDETVNGTDGIGLGPLFENPPLDIIAVNNPPVASFDAATISSINEGYSELYVKVNASDPDGDAISVMLKIDGIDIRQENGSPYEWGHATTPQPQETLGLTPGEHTFEATVTDSKGAKTTVSKTITVFDLKIAPTIEIISPDDGAEFDLGEDIVIEAIASDEDGTVTKVNFKLDGEYHAKGQNGVDGVYTSIYSPTEARTYVLGARAFDDEGESKEVSITVEVKLITGTTDDVSNEFSAFPNPTTGVVHLGEKVAWELMSSQGEVLSRGVGNEVDLSGQTKGVYFLKMNSVIEKIIFQ